MTRCPANSSSATASSGSMRAPRTRRARIAAKGLGSHRRGAGHRRQDDEGRLDDAGRQAHIMSVVGHESEHCYAQKGRYPACSRCRRTQAGQRNRHGHPAAHGMRTRRPGLTADALLTQRALAEHIVRQGAHHHFTVKGNRPVLQAASALYFKERGAPDYTPNADPGP